MMALSFYAAILDQMDLTLEHMEMGSVTDLGVRLVREWPPLTDGDPDLVRLFRITHRYTELFNTNSIDIALKTNPLQRLNSFCADVCQSRVVTCDLPEECKTIDKKTQIFAFCGFQFFVKIVSRMTVYEGNLGVAPTAALYD
jgi:hypothetical protein